MHGFHICLVTIRKATSHWFRETSTFMFNNISWKEICLSKQVAVREHRIRTGSGKPTLKKKRHSNDS